jgi:tryptophan-rich sensory protein
MKDMSKCKEANTLQKGHRTVLLALFAIAYLLVSAWLAMMTGPVYGTALFIGLFLLLTLILVFAVRKLK